MKSCSTRYSRSARCLVWWMILCFTGSMVPTAFANEIAAPPPKIEKTVFGRAFFDGPIYGGDVVIYDEAMTPILSHKAITDLNGFFAIQTPHLPPSFFIGVSGGTVVKTDTSGNTGYEPFMETIGRFVYRFDPGELVKVNIMSSLLLAAWAYKPLQNYDEIKKVMHDYLQFPDYYSMDDIIDQADWNTALFDPQYFFEGMKDHGYHQYSQFAEYVADLIYRYHQDPRNNSFQEYPWRNMPEAMRNSALSQVISDCGAPDGYGDSAQTGAAAGGGGSAIGEGIDMIFNIFGFILNAVYKNTAETEFGRTLGNILMYLFEGGPDPAMTAIIQNLTAIREGIIKIDQDLNNFWAQMERELKDIKRIILSQELNSACNQIRNWHDKLTEWGNAYRENKEKPQPVVVDVWTTEVKDTSTGVRKRVEAIYNALCPVNEKSLIMAWYESLNTVGNPYRKPEVNAQIYEAMRSNLVKLMMFQAIGLNIYAEMINKSVSNKEDAKALILDFVNDVMNWFKKETGEFERVVEEAYALNQEWNLYVNDPNLEAKDRCPDFPGGLGDKGILNDLDKIVQRFLYAQLIYKDGKIESVHQQHLITARVVAPQKNPEIEEDFGLKGLDKQSSYYWDIYNEYAFSQLNSSSDIKPGWKPKDIPATPEAGPGSDTAGKDFEIASLNVRVSTVDIPFTIDPNDWKTYGGRSPFETRNTQIGSREKWNYRMVKFRKAIPLKDTDIKPNTDFEVQFSVKNVHPSGWHPNLKPLNSQQIDKKETIRWDNTKDPALCLSFGAYGIKSPQKVRVMAYHGQGGWHDWWYRGFHNNSGTGRLYANRLPVFTWFDLIPMGMGWYAFKDAGTRAWDFPRAYPPIVFFGDKSSKYIQTEGRDYIRVSDHPKGPGEIEFNLNYIDYLCAFKLGYKQTVDPFVVSSHGTWAGVFASTQPAGKVYTVKTNYPNIDNPGANFYFKWRYMFAAWDRYLADGTLSDTESFNMTWVMIYPEYDNLANWILDRPNNWNPVTNSQK